MRPLVSFFLIKRVEAHDPLLAVRSASDFTSTMLKKPPSIALGEPRWLTALLAKLACAKVARRFDFDDCQINSVRED